MKIQIDENKYLTGNYCTTGGLDNSIEMLALPSDDVVFYTAYQILSQDVSKIITVEEPVVKIRELKYPILDEDGNETGEFNIITEEYTEIEQVEKTIIETTYYYQLDEVKRKEIENAPIPVDNTPNLAELAKWTVVMQDVIDALLFKE